MRFQNVFHQHFITQKDFLVYNYDPPLTLVAWALTVRKQCLAVLSRTIPGQSELGVAQALILGEKEGLSDEIKSTFASTGAMHVLAVSGLHVGIIYLIISFIFLPLKKISGGKWLFLAVNLLVLWSYALVTGFSPSVIRAATMFSFFAIAETTRRRTNIYNTLACSAFLLLCFNPYLIMSVGFQLSYLAVAGIVYLQLRIYRWFYFDNWMLDKAWQLTAVSLAAQLATFPMGLYYFHQFPTYFLLSNLLVIPAASVILILGIITIAVGLAFPGISFYSGGLLAKIIFFVNYSLVSLQKLPFSKINFFPISLQQTMLIYGGIVSILLLFYFRKFRYFLWCLGCTISFVLLDFSKALRQSQQEKIIFYNLYQQSIVEFVQHQNAFIAGELNDKSLYTINQSRLANGITPVSMPQDSLMGQMPNYQINNLKLVVWQGKTFVFVIAPFRNLNEFTEKINADFVIITRNAVQDLSRLKQFLNFSFLIIDSSNHFFTVQKLVDQAKSTRTPHHAISRQGAFVLNMKEEFSSE